MSTQITREQIQNSIDQHETLKNVWFWKPSGNARGRRYNEMKWEQKHPAYQGMYKNHEVQVYTSYRESCRNVYYKMSVVIDGKPGTVRSLKKLIEEV